ncbi:3-oxo-5-alpha-steroid 4-dehydrogenase 1 [Anguilla rostrata]|uniref:3-oxo-5-alpha-steroid 4-dehydrogenase 1 n=1 Tax=Anguilla rostrata TaxID=7938 RepID=UPI0030D0C335
MGDIFTAVFGSEDEEHYILQCMSYILIFMAGATFLTLLFENVPYGRYATSKYGFPVNVKLAWFVQELPAFVLPVFLVLKSSAPQLSDTANRFLIAMYFCHYVHRSLIYPFLIRGGKPTPFFSFALAFVFCIYNGYLQIRHLSHFAEYPKDWVRHPWFIAGFVLWLLGWLVNIHSDHILRNLRKPGETGYKIPVGGMFEYVSGANFLGEIVEWSGFALAAHSIHSAAFAIFTFVVLSSRAVAHHKWYLAKFEDYPKSRKALIPFIF